jgi:hypothetical protein
MPKESHILVRLASILLLVASLALLGAGCANEESKVGASSTDKKSQAKRPTETAASASHDHGDWWCEEHGVPEGICGQCDAKVAAELKKKGDWCNKHDRPDSQCFVCHPELEAKFAALYEAKYGKKPPKPRKEDATPKKDL